MSSALDRKEVLPTADLKHHGDAELGPGLLNLAVNVSAEEPPAWLTSAILSACTRLAAYPDARPATRAVAVRHGRAEDEVLLTAGAAEAFTLIAQGLRRGRACIVHPQFTEPEVALRVAGWDVTRVVLDEDDGFVLDPRRIPDECSLVVVGNPTNPTGTLHPVGTLQALRTAGRTLVVDEAFLDSVPGEPDSMAGPADLDGVLVVRSLTKTWGLAGLRAGYVLGDPALITLLSGVQPAWSVSTPALAAAVVCSAERALLEAERRATMVSAERERLRDALRDRDFVVARHSHGPFLLVRHRSVKDLHRRLRDKGIAVRRGDTFPGLDDDRGWLRIAVRDRRSTDVLLDTLDGMLAGGPGPAVRPGTLTLIGGGPGPETLITVQGLTALQHADVVITDRLAPLDLLEHLRLGVLVIDAAKNPRGKAMSQETINSLIIEHALAGRDVVRFKGGDSFVFGRGFEEQQACAAVGIASRVVPGVSSAIAGPALAGVPVTHRGMTHGFVVVSGHLAPDDPQSLADWTALAHSRMTLVILMGVAKLGAIADVLMAAGLAGSTPAALVADAGASTQRRILTNLDRIAPDASAAGVQPPAIAVIGAVAGLAGELGQQAAP